MNVCYAVQDGGELVVGPLPVGGSLNPEVIARASVRAHADHCDRRRLGCLDGRAQIHSVSSEVGPDRLAVLVVGQPSVQSHRNAEPGQGDRDVRRAATGCGLEAVTGRGGHQVHDRFADDSDGVFIAHESGRYRRAHAGADGSR